MCRGYKGYPHTSYILDIKAFNENDALAKARTSTGWQRTDKWDKAMKTYIDYSIVCNLADRQYLMNTSGIALA